MCVSLDAPSLLPCTAGTEPGEKLIHEGWAVKESGTKFCGRYQWQKRWFRLVTDQFGVSSLSYYRQVTFAETLYVCEAII